MSEPFCTCVLPCGQTVKVPLDVLRLWGTAAACMHDCDEDNSDLPIPITIATPDTIAFLIYFAKTFVEDRKFFEANLDRYLLVGMPKDQQSLLNTKPYPEIVALLTLANFLQYNHLCYALARYLGRTLATDTTEMAMEKLGVDSTVPLTDAQKEIILEQSVWLQ